jgi:hypothetical protein
MKAMKNLRMIVPAIIIGMLMTISACSPVRDGWLKGTVSIGPLSPVEMVGVPTSTPPPEVFTSRGLRIINSFGIEIHQLHFTPVGTFSIQLSPGKYRLELLNPGIEHATGLPNEIEIQPGQIVSLTISIDTGIR